MRPRSNRIILAVCCSVGVFATLPARGADEGAVEEVLGALRDEGVIDDAQYSRIVSKNAASEAEKWWERIAWFGDFRFRHESFWYNEDPTGNERDDRMRLRYRLRIGATADVNEHARVTLRLSSDADGNARSRNQTIGGNPDFSPDEIWIDQAFVTLSAPDSWFPGENGSAKLILGKQPNLFRWKHGRNFNPWDSDLTPSGAALALAYQLGDNAEFSVNTGYFVLQEFSTKRDPSLAGVQLRGDFRLDSDISVGGLATYYGFRSLDAGFLQRGVHQSLSSGGFTTGGGNLAGGLTDGSGVDVGEFGIYAQFTHLPDWPVIAYGHTFHNFSAQSTPFGGKEDLAWGTGLEIGDPKKVAQIGVAYWWIEANSFPGQFPDATFMTGFNNRKGFAFFAGKELFRDLEVRVSVFLTDVIDSDLLDPDGSGGTNPARSVSDSDLVRMTSDVVFHF